MNAAQVETRLTESYERTRPYLPALVQRLALTYGLPMLAAVLISTLGSRLLLALLPEFPLSTATLLTLGANILVLVRGWQWLEKRFGGTKLFFLYIVVSRNRRELKRLLQQSPLDSAAINKAMQQLSQAENDFVGAMGAVGQSA
jgi:hypothetical protein